MECVSDAVLLSGAAILLWLYLKVAATAKPAAKPSRGLKDKQDQPGLSLPSYMSV